jgi:hypothetical protein|tara:strand:+ start:2030 stop:2305 length:276 start_codon:yes stop_codon:yes gene_type:complete
MSTGTINIKLEGVSFQHTERLRKIIHTLISQGVFNIKNGNAVLSFDDEGSLAAIELNIKKWKKGKEPPLLQDHYKNATIEIIDPVTLETIK